MNIGIDISQIVYNGSGVSRFTEGLVRAILSFDKTNNWTFFFSSLRQRLDPVLKTAITEKGFRVEQYPFPPTLLSIVFNDLHSYAKIITANHKPLASLDWFITSDWSEPPLPVKKATIVHDLVFKKYPETVHPTILNTQEKRLSHVSRESDLVFVDSHSTANDLIREYVIPSHKVIVNYPGVETSEPAIQPNSELLDRYQIRKPYILAVGKREPRKNLSRLIEAFKNTDTTAMLVIVGPKGWGDDDNKKSDDIVYLGFVPDDDLAQLYANAYFFIYPSLYEGFGYPIVEAMRYGCPVATSSTSSLSEIAKDAALLFDPEQIHEISSAIQRLFDDEDLRKELIQKGKKRAKLFTWERYYNTLIKQLTSHT